MNTSIQVRYLVQDLRCAIHEVKKKHNKRPIIKMSPDTHDDILDYLHSKATSFGDFAVQAGGLKKFMGCDVQIECCWSFGLAVETETLEKACRNSFEGGKPQ